MLHCYNVHNQINHEKKIKVKVKINHEYITVSCTWYKVNDARMIHVIQGADLVLLII